MDNSIEARVNRLVADQLGYDVAQVKPESSLVNDLGADSLDLVELVMAYEDEFDFLVPDEDWEKLTTPQHLYDYAKANVRQAA